MGKNKLAKFKAMEGYPHVFGYQPDRIEGKDFGLKGRWGEEVFGNANPLVLELGCGRGEYTVGLGRLFGGKNFVGVDVKGARMWSGAKESLEAGMRNVAFLRTPVEWVASCFAPGEVDEIWLTFPDPQMKKRGKRLTSAAFMERYGRMLRPGGLVHLKTDSRFLYTYTTEMIRANGLPLLRATDNLYGSGPAGDILSIQTSYEQQWLQRGMAIKYLCFALEARESFAEPGVEIAMDDYRSFNRSKRSALSSAK